MTDNDSKKSLSLKDRNINAKSLKNHPSSKNVTIQVKRKKIINTNTGSEKNPEDSVNKKNQTSPKDIHVKKNIKNNQINNQIKTPDIVPTKKKNKFDKDEKIEQFENKELHLKSKAKKTSKNKSEPDQSLLSQHQFEKPTEPVKKVIEITESITVGELAQKISMKSAELVKTIMNLGVMATINQTLDQETAILIIEELGHEAKIKISEIDDVSIEPQVTSTDNLAQRAPIVTIMGHVDHGKTSLLDFIRKTKVVNSEAGGITQHIGAYQVETSNGKITFLDTPGHAAFSSMRARGAQITDIVILIVSADDGVMPQTEEAIEHAQSANVPIIVAINKIDKENADPEKVLTELSKKNVVPEEWGGDTICIKVSAITGEGIDQLLEAISLQSEILELKASSTGSATGTVVESSLDKGKGPVATVLIQSGILNKKDYILVGKEFGRVRAMFNEFNKEVTSAGPSSPIVITGLSGTPNVADKLISTNDERKVKEIASARESKQKEIEMQSKQKTFSIDNFNPSNQTKKKIINLIIKSDVQGSAEAIVASLQSIKNDDVGLDIIYSGIGAITESDANLAVSSGSKIIGFNVRADAKAKKLIEINGQELSYFSVIYDLIDNIKQQLSGLLDPDIKEEIIGIAEVKDVFRSSKIGAIAGSIVSEGVIQKDQPIRVLRDNIVIYEGELESLRRFKEDVKEVKSGVECGIGVKDYNDVREGDQIEVFKRIEVKRNI
ncbi:MAG: translation initiation factor IF-2 [Gammaproteobacteria bacterium]|nr:translation initiation factor IF-2 [Gammaproteobacteria bacterium]|tara:strand:- start:1455 stop:3632 length:2178 start_codon:yes stop_codon:yes gene_type:complete